MVNNIGEGKGKKKDANTEDVYIAGGYDLKKCQERNLEMIGMFTLNFWGKGN